ncbi:MAG TPA: GtrA family protein [Candidatus Paceibacterota bacterium]|nr:GtrA family protein [Candidatus Paceibacterota bacterium]
MRLLITTQALDLDDPILGFFHRWLEEFSKHCESIHVLCLKEGRHNVPANVFVHSLGKEKGRSRIKYIFNFYRYMWRLRKEYDSVFVHMNSEYVVLGGIFWRLSGKRIVLWRNHKKSGFMTSCAVRIVHAVCYTSPSAFVAKFKNAVRMPIGIDTKFFSPGVESPQPHSILFLGRLDPVKNVDVFVRALDQLHETDVGFFADIVGDPTDPKSDYAHDVRNLVSPLVLEGVAAMHGGVTNEAARDLYRTHVLYVNLTPSGSFDKTIGEALAVGCLVVAANDAVKALLPEKLFVHDPNSIEETAHALKAAFEIGEEEQRAIASQSRAAIIRDHSLALLAEKLTALLQSAPDPFALFVRFCIVGAIGAVVQLLVLYVLHGVFEMWYLSASVLAFLAAALVGYLLQRGWTFRSKSARVVREAGGYGLILVANFFLNVTFMYVLVDVLGAWYLGAQALSIAVLSVGSFFANRAFVFKK